MTVVRKLHFLTRAVLFRYGSAKELTSGDLICMSFVQNDIPLHFFFKYDLLLWHAKVINSREKRIGDMQTFIASFVSYFLLHLYLIT